MREAGYFCVLAHFHRYWTKGKLKVGIHALDFLQDRGLIASHFEQLSPERFPVFRLHHLNENFSVGGGNNTKQPLGQRHLFQIAKQKKEEESATSEFSISSFSRNR